MKTLTAFAFSIMLGCAVLALGLICAALITGAGERCADFCP